MSVKTTIQAERIVPTRKKVFVTELESGASVSRGGIILPDDDMRESGIRERWARVHAVGAEVDDLHPGDWVLLQHGRWTPGFDQQHADGSRTRLWSIDYPDAVLLVSDEDPRRAALSLIEGGVRA